MRIYGIVALTTTLIHRSMATTCESLCAGVDSCANDPHAHGSYCKLDVYPNVCFGLYYTSSCQSTICFEPNDAGCPHDLPVLCTTTTPPPPSDCQALCDNTPECANDPQAQGSYCKNYLSPSVCFGMTILFP